MHDALQEKPTVQTVSDLHSYARLQAVLDLIEHQKTKLQLPADARVVVSYEAGQDGFWICRSSQSCGIERYVVDAASIPVERLKRHAKTDRLDAIRLIAFTDDRRSLLGQGGAYVAICDVAPEEGEQGVAELRERGMQARFSSST